MKHAPTITGAAAIVDAVVGDERRNEQQSEHGKPLSNESCTCPALCHRSPLPRTLHMPPIVTVLPPICVSSAHDLDTRSVVVMATAGEERGNDVWKTS